MILRLWVPLRIGVPLQVNEYKNINGLYIYASSGRSFCSASHPQVTTQRLNINYKCSPNTSGLLLANFYVSINPYPHGLVPFFSTACPSWFSLSARDTSDSTLLLPSILCLVLLLTLSCPSLSQPASLLSQSQRHIFIQRKRIHTRPAHECHQGSQWYCHIEILNWDDQEEYATFKDG